MAASSTSDFAVETIRDLLEGEPEPTWTDGAVEVWKWHETNAKGRKGIERGLFVWSPSDTDFERFSADGKHMDQTDTVEVVIGTYDDRETARLIEDTVDVLSQYMDDNHANVNFRSIEPTSAADDRANSILRQTDHLTGTVTITLEVLRTAGT